MKNIIFILTIFLLTILFSSFKQDSIKKENIIAKTLIDNSSELTEAQAYRMLYENQLKSNNSILSTIYYALGGLGGALLLVFASNWWFNEKKVKDIIKEIDEKIKGVKKETLAELMEKISNLSEEKIVKLNQLQDEIQKELSDSIKASSLKMNEFTEKTRAEIKNDNNVLLANYQKQLETFNENYRQQLSIISDNFSSQLTNLTESISIKENSLKNLIQAEKDGRDEGIINISKKLHRIEYYMWEAKGVSRNAFSALISELSYKLKVDTDIRDIRLNLEQMGQTLKKCEKIYPFEKDKVLNLFEKLPKDEKLTELKNTIITRFEEILFDKQFL